VARPPAIIIDPGPVARPANWLQFVNQPQTDAEVLALRESLRRGRPFGAEPWRIETAQRLGLESSLRPRGRPRKAAGQAPTLFGEASEEE
jgi:putative transposase